MLVASVAKTLKGYNTATETTLVKGNTFTVTAISDTNVITTFTVVVK